LKLSVGLRPAGDKDTEFLYRLYASTRAEEMALVDWTEDQVEQFLRMQFQAQHTYYHEQFKQAAFDVIEQNDIAIGRLYVDRREQEIRIIDIALLPEYRGWGIGGAIMQALIDEAVGSNRSVSIHVEHNNPAMHLYQRLGFRHVSDEGVYFFMKWEPPDAPQARDQENTAS
jgi:ribosomal protein S18 acetylase RimI-like enzyme